MSCFFSEVMKNTWWIISTILKKQSHFHESAQPSWGLGDLTKLSLIKSPKAQLLIFITFPPFRKAGLGTVSTQEIWPQRGLESWPHPAGSTVASSLVASPRLGRPRSAWPEVFSPSVWCTEANQIWQRAIKAACIWNNSLWKPPIPQSIHPYIHTQELKQPLPVGHAELSAGCTLF